MVGQNTQKCASEFTLGAVQSGTVLCECTLEFLYSTKSETSETFRNHMQVGDFQTIKHINLGNIKLVL